nr:uncharacterized protein LOC111516623 isoform X2 [Leptinotarsa decemlineata]
MDMASFECGRQIKGEIQSVGDEVPFQKLDVKSEPSDAEMFSKCGRNGDASDTNMPTNDLDENDEFKMNMPMDKFDPEEVKIEETFLIPYLDLKSENCENAIMEGSNLKACEEELFSHENGSSNIWRNHNESHAILFENMTEDLKPSVGFTTDTGNIPVEIKEETMFEEKEEIFNENIPSGSNGKEFVVENDHVKHEMVQTIVNEQYYSTNCLNLKTSEKLLTGEKPFQCKICSKSFIQESALKYHEKIHRVEKCKDNWTKLRNAYASAIKRRKNKKGGQAASQVIAWKYEEQINFLRPHMESRNAKTNFPEPTPESPIDMTPCSPPDVFVNDSQNSSASQPPQTQSSDASWSDGSQRSSASKRTLSVNNKPSLKDIYDLMKSSNEVKKQRQHAKPDMDDTDLFFLSMSKAVKALPKLDQCKIKLDLHTAVSQAEIRKLTQTDYVLKTPLNIVSQTTIPKSSYQPIQSPASIQPCKSVQSYDFSGSTLGTNSYQELIQSPTIIQSFNSPEIGSPESRDSRTNMEEHC